jgi:hypothetical protein
VASLPCLPSGQVVLEALASGLPVVGLDAEGTRDLVIHSQTGLLLSLPDGAKDWPQALKNDRSAFFEAAAEEYARLLARVLGDENDRKTMGSRAVKGANGRSWHEVRVFFFFFFFFFFLSRLLLRYERRRTREADLISPFYLFPRSIRRWRCASTRIEKP